MRSILLLAFLFMCQNLLAQRECASSQYLQQQLTLQPELAKQMISVENQIQSHSASRLTASTLVKIPVVVHILYNTASQNISDEQVKSQLKALNRDFRRSNSDTSNTPSAFRSTAADVMIEFVLATADPAGRATSGIVRKASPVTEWRMDDKIKFTSEGGSDAWDSDSYLNIWVGPMRSLLGYSSVPGCEEVKDGIVINTTAFGTIDKSGPFNLGRTLVHEAGHWLGLRHIWGDSYCGDDLVGDTPKQGGFTTGCPSGYRSTCSNGTTGDMFMNYMDFTDDACMNLFTEGQKERMRSLFYDGGARYGLLASKGLSNPWNATLAESPLPAIAFSVYPNPAQERIVLQLGAENRSASFAEIVGLNGVVVKKEKITGTATSINLAGLASGIYYVQVKNGGQLYRQKFVRL